MWSIQARQNKLELSRAYTPCALLLWLDDPFLYWAQTCTVPSAHISRVGVIDKPQACWTYISQFVALLSHFQQFEACRYQFFIDIYWFVVLIAPTDAYNSRSCDFVQTRTTTNGQADCFTPCMKVNKQWLQPLSSTLWWKICLFFLPLLICHIGRLTIEVY